ncbi:hypothetical protein ACFBZI_04780 [Moraxella sp. ZJ142]|uniref:hypothetical protein n=1 Tax=Moraxella marmotae TaxID=3344520 RepID=UPI0035D4A8A1
MNKKTVILFLATWLSIVLFIILHAVLDLNIYIFRFIFFALVIMIVFLSLCIGGFVFDSNIKLIKNFFKKDNK